MEECNNVDINAWRHGYKWNVNECLRLEREYDLLKLSVPEMSILHKRTMNAIMCKLQDEGLDTFNNLYVKTFGKDEHIVGKDEHIVGKDDHIVEKDDYIVEKDDINEQINKLNNLSSFVNDEDEDYEEESDEEDDEDDEEDEDYEEESDEEDDEDEGDVEYYVDDDDGSNHAYVFDQVKRLHKHITNLLGYFSKMPSTKSVKNCNYAI
jgi:hypothetical protein